MASKKAHINLANKNRKAIEYLCVKLNDHHDWVATVAFYQALHMIDALLASPKIDEHPYSHRNRNGFLKRNHRYDFIYKHYWRLYRASRIARYLADNHSGYTTFSDCMSPEDVETDILKNHLANIEKGIARLSSPGKKKKKK